LFNSKLNGGKLEFNTPLTLIVYGHYNFAPQLITWLIQQGAGY